MVKKVSQFQESLGLSLERKSRMDLLQSRGEGSQNNQQIAQVQDSFSFSMDLRRSLQIVEGESRSQIVKAFEMEVSISVSASGKLESSLRRESEKAQEAEPVNDDPFSPENTSKRIVDFVKQALAFTRKFTDNPVETDEQMQRFAELQTNAVKEGFRQARRLLGKLPDEVNSGIGKTYDLTMKGLDELFNPKAESEEGEVAEEQTAISSGPASAGYYSSQSFSLSFKLQVQANGEFDQKELSEFIDSSFNSVQDAFSKYFRGGKDSGAETFDPLALFSNGSFSLDRMKSLLA